MEYSEAVGKLEAGIRADALSKARGAIKQAIHRAMCDVKVNEGLEVTSGHWPVDMGQRLRAIDASGGCYSAGELMNLVADAWVDTYAKHLGDRAVESFIAQHSETVVRKTAIETAPGSDPHAAQREHYQAVTGRRVVEENVTSSGQGAGDGNS